MKQGAQRAGAHYVTAYRWFREGKLPVPARPVGQLILVEPSAVERPAGAAAVYARVSPADRRPGPDRPVARVTAWATGRELEDLLRLWGRHPATGGCEQGAYSCFMTRNGQTKTVSAGRRSRAKASAGSTAASAGWVESGAIWVR